MNFIRLEFIYIINTIIFILPIDMLTDWSSLKREIRFTTFSVVSLNKTIATVQDSSIKQFYDQQKLFSHVIFHKSVSDIELSFTVSKCKTHYIDCINVVSYEICGVCSKIQFLTDFSDLTTSNNRSIACPFFGNYDFKNLTFHAEKFGTTFSFPTEKWWEYYWKFNVLVYSKDKLELIRTSIDFYVIEFRSRNRQRKYS